MDKLEKNLRTSERKHSDLRHTYSQFRINKNKNYSSIASQKDNTKSTISYGSISPSLSFQKGPRSSVHHELISKISDFYDKKQINDAILSIQNVGSRKKFLDAIVQRRSEIQEIENQTKLEKVAPLVSKVSARIRRQVLTKSSGSRFKKLSNQLESLNIRHSHRDSFVTTCSDSEANVSRMSWRCDDDKPDSTSSPLLKDIGHRSLLNRPTLDIPPIVVISPGGEQMSPFKTFDSPGLENQKSIDEHSVQTRTSKMKKTSKVLALLTRHTVQKALSPKGLVFKDSENKNQMNGFYGVVKMTMDQTDKPPASIALRNGDYHLGAKSLEKDLYRYLVRNENTEIAKKLVTGLGEPKEPMMKDIEQKAKAKFFSFMEQKRQINNMLPNSFITKSNVAERTKFIMKTCKCNSHQAKGKTEKEVNNLDEKKRGSTVRNSVIVRNVNIQDLLKEDYAA